MSDTFVNSWVTAAMSEPVSLKLRTPREVITHEIGEIGSESYEVDPWEQQADNIIRALADAGYVIVWQKDLAPLYHLYEANRIVSNMNIETYKAGREAAGVESLDDPN